MLSTLKFKSNLAAGILYGGEDVEAPVQEDAMPEQKPIEHPDKSMQFISH